MNPIDQPILDKLARLGLLLHARNPAIVDELWSPGFRLIGSERGEIAETREELLKLFDALFDHPARFRWAWETTSVSQAGDVAWVFAEGHVEIRHPDRGDRRPYRLVAVFEKIDGDWRWRLFSGSEPA